MRWGLIAVLTVGAVMLGGFLATAPRPLPAAQQEALAALDGDAVRGETVFWAAGCASCHTAPNGEDKLVLAGGAAFVTEFGTFYAPNISTDPDQGLGDWTLAQFADAVQRGVSPEGAHYYPAFPFTAYANMTAQEVADLWAFWSTLPASDTPSRAHDLGFPANIRRGVGLWKLANPPAPAPQGRGAHLVEALVHCGECHTPRDWTGGLDRSQWLRGAPNPSGEGRIPGLGPDQLTWSQDEIASYLADGFTPEFDSVGGSMVSVVDNLSRLPDADRSAIAAYLKALSPP